MKTILNNWLAKTLSLVLALILWTVIKKSLGPTTSPSSFQFDADEKFRFDTTRYGNPAKK